VEIVSLQIGGSGMGVASRVSRALANREELFRESHASPEAGEEVR